MWSKFMLFFGVKKDATKIPEGPYCYAPDYEKNAKENFNSGIYYTKPCPYYKSMGRYNGCSFLGHITDDCVFDDQCKICSENDGYLD